MHSNIRWTQKTFAAQHADRRPKKAVVSVLLAVMLLLNLPLAFAAHTAEYRDDVFSFRYPASWNQRKAKDGSLLLEVPGRQDSGIQAFSITTDLMALTGDEETDKPAIQDLIKNQQNSKSKLKLSGEYEMLQYGALKGFRALGTWAGSIKAQQVYLSDGAHMLVFRFIGDAVLEEQENILSSVVVNNAEKPLARDGYMLLERKNYSLLYPENYNMLEQDTGIAFIDKTKGNTIMVRVRTLDTDYTEALASSLAIKYLPKSTKVEAKPEMVTVGPWRAALISGQTGSGPLAFYALGSGRTVLLVLFLGQDALTHTEAVFNSLTIK